MRRNTTTDIINPVNPVILTRNISGNDKQRIKPYIPVAVTTGLEQRNREDMAIFPTCSSFVVSFLRASLGVFRKLLRLVRKNVFGTIAAKNSLQQFSLWFETHVDAFLHKQTKAD